MRDFSNAIGTIRAMAGSIGTFRRSSTGSTNVASIMVKGTMDPKELARLVSFSSKAIKQPLTSLASPPEQSAAVTAFTYVMQFMGDLPTRKNRFELANVLVGMGMLHQQLVDELYCQIIKQIINNNSRKEYVSDEIFFIYKII
jgi:hypothetical protein